MHVMHPDWMDKEMWHSPFCLLEVCDTPFFAYLGSTPGNIGTEFRGTRSEACHIYILFFRLHSNIPFADIATRGGHPE